MQQHRVFNHLPQEASRAHEVSGAGGGQNHEAAQQPRGEVGTFSFRHSMVVNAFQSERQDLLSSQYLLTASIIHCIRHILLCSQRLRVSWANHMFSFAGGKPSKSWPCGTCQGIVSIRIRNSLLTSSSRPTRCKRVETLFILLNPVSQNLGQCWLTESNQDKPLYLEQVANLFLVSFQLPICKIQGTEYY